VTHHKFGFTRVQGRVTSAATTTANAHADVARLASVGVTKRLHQLVADGNARGGNHQAAVGFDEGVVVDGDHPQRCAIRGQLHVTGTQAQLIAGDG
jgi:hypothetical protein